MKTNYRRILSVALALIMALSVVFAIPLAGIAEGSVPEAAEGTPNADNVQKITDAEIYAKLQANAVTNSTNRGEEGADDGAPKFAFENDSSSTKRWIQSFNGSNAYGSHENASASNPIWIQSGFGTETADAKTIGAIGYLPEANTSNVNVITAYKVYASFVPATKDTPYDEIVSNSLLVAEGTFELQDSRAEQVAYFKFPVTANYITLVALGSGHDGTGSGAVAAQEVFFYEYTGSGEQPSETEPSETEPSEPEPSETEPSETEPSETEPSETEPSETEPSETEPSETEPSETEPSETEPSEPEPSKVSYGDVDGSKEINATDATFVLQYFAKIITDDSDVAFDKAAADVDGSKEINATDATLILQYFAKIITKFPVSSGGSIDDPEETLPEFEDVF